MRAGYAGVGLGMLLGALLQACDRGSPVASDEGGPYRTVEIDLGAQPGCVWVVDTAVMTVTPEGGPARELRQTVPVGATTVRFDDVDVPQGMVEFAVRILSNNGSLLYDAQVSQRIDAATFSVPITVVKRAPVLEVCPGDILFDRETRSFTPIEVKNRGLGTLAYQAVSPQCDAIPCLEFEVDGGSVPERETEPFFVFLPRMVPQASLELPIQSAEGTVAVAFPLPQVPELGPVSFDSTGPHLFLPPDTVIVPVRVVVRNDGNVAAGIFKLAAFYTEENQNTFVTRFEVPGQEAEFYPFTAVPLAPGGAITIDGRLLMVGVPDRQTVQLRVEVDSCAGDELMPDFCRVDEFEEFNNLSGSLPAFIPSPPPPPVVP